MDSATEKKMSSNCKALLQEVTCKFNSVLGSFKRKSAQECCSTEEKEEIREKKENFRTAKGNFSDEDEDYQKVARVVLDKVLMDIMKTMNNHPIKELKACLARLSVIKKGDKRLMLMDYTRIVILKAFQA